MKVNMIPARMLTASIATFLTGATALALSIASPALSQGNNHQGNNPPGPPPHGPMHHADFLNLTEEQQAQIEQIHQNTRSQIDAILTEEQKAQLQRDRENRGPRDDNGPRDGNGPRGGDKDQGMPPRPPFDSLNLTDAQRSQIETIMRSAKEQMDAVLTPEQLQKLQEHEQQRQQRRSGN